MPGANPHRGFTLAEVLLVAVILLAILGVLVFMAISHQKSYLSMDASIQVSEEARRALDFMTRELRGAGGMNPVVVVAADASSLEFQVALGYDRPDFGCADDAACFGAKDASGLGHHDWKIRYAVTNPGTGCQLIRQVLDAGNSEQARRVLATKIDGRSDKTFFEWDAAKRITLHLSVITPSSSLIPGGSRSSGVITSQIDMRN